jgi:hypothetical protein
MFARAIFLRGREAPVVLQYRTADGAAEVDGEHGSDGSVIFFDDFGRIFFCLESDVLGVLVTDVAREQEAGGEIALIGAREQAKLNTRAAADPVLKFANSGRPGLVG